ncbi:DUF3261 domain-containing protein [Vibrio sp. RE86]|uniref:DUF3261 domain-containing protein n=1 Tax=Vibrio sp. RE86 TaxID=2607605 RepID=UPI0014934982|nr:DUF3261 domain-containing protein [Vibrio sp. RE86]NOH78736.1 DUF3261 domain-containing protein [Vibrio sp. RE86]
MSNSILKKAILRKTLLAALLTSVLSACSMQPQSVTPSVKITEQEKVNLPTPSSLGYTLTASQLISASWEQGEQSGTQQLPVQLQVDQDKLVLAGFSSWGTRVLSLSYQGDEISTEVLTGLNNVLPAPEQVLFNLMITLWPSSAWEAPLNKVRWQLIDKGNSRAVFDKQGNQVIDIQYGNSDKLKGQITFRHLVDNYTIVINTLDYQK